MATVLDLAFLYNVVVAKFTCMWTLLLTQVNLKIYFYPISQLSPCTFTQSNALASFFIHFITFGIGSSTCAGSLFGNLATLFGNLHNVKKCCQKPNLQFGKAIWHTLWLRDNRGNLGVSMDGLQSSMMPREEFLFFSKYPEIVGFII